MLRRSAPERVLDLRPGLLEVALDLVTTALADEGAHVVAGSRSTGSLDGLKCVTAVAVDLSPAEGPAQLIQCATEEHGQIDVLVNDVGAVRMRTEGFLGTSDEDFAWAMQMNFFIALRASRAALTAMAGRGAGAIVNVASVNAFFQPDAARIDYGDPAGCAEAGDDAKALRSVMPGVMAISRTCTPGPWRCTRPRAWLVRKLHSGPG